MAVFAHPQTGAPVTVANDSPAERILLIAGWEPYEEPAAPDPAESAKPESLRTRSKVTEE